MSDMQVQPESTPAVPQTAPLTQWQRVVYIFSAPSKTFLDIRDHSRSWWMPFILSAIAAYLLFAAISFKVGMSQVVENSIRMDPKAEERMAQTPPDQKAMAMKIALYTTEGVFIAQPIFVLIGTAVFALGLWGTINFGFGGKATYGSVFAVWMYGSLPALVKVLLGIAVLFTGMAPESFNIKNFAPTNPAAFLSPTETNAALYSLAGWLDVVTIWSLIVVGIGVAIVARVKRPSGYIAVFAWWALFVLVSVAWAAIRG